jgi:hypothetical protein
MHAPFVLQAMCGGLFWVQSYPNGPRADYAERIPYHQYFVSAPRHKHSSSLDSSEP